MSWVPIPDGSPYPLANLPLGVGHDGDRRSRAWVAVGDHALDLDAAAGEGCFADIDVPERCFADAHLGRFLGAGREVWSAVRRRVRNLLDDPAARARLSPHLTPRSSLTMGVPVAPVDYVDFYSSLHHATNLGRILRPGGEPVLPNWRHIPVGYHGRTGSLVADGTPIRRPVGHRLVDGEPVVGPTRMLDIELEVGTVVGVGAEVGTPIPIERAGDHLFGICLVDDWSARDVQAFEYQPLGPFLGKSFATSVSSWLVPFEALEPFRVAPPPQDPPAAAHLRTDEPWGLDLDLEVWIESAQMRSVGLPPVRISRVGFADMYWTAAQQLAHMTVNGAGAHPGDLFASGTVSGPEPGTEGSLIEMTWRGERPIELPDGSQRAFLEDGDRVELRGWAGRDPASRIGLGSVSGTVVAPSERGGI